MASRYFSTLLHDMASSRTQLFSSVSPQFAPPRLALRCTLHCSVRHCFVRLEQASKQTLILRVFQQGLEPVGYTFYRIRQLYQISLRRED